MRGILVGFLVAIGLAMPGAGVAAPAGPGLLDEGPFISVGGLTPVEGTGVTNLIHVPVTLSTDSVVSVSVDFSTANDSATAGADYIATNGTLVIPAGLTTGIIEVAIIGDNLFESNEAFVVTLQNAVNAAIADGSGEVTIQEDDPAPALSVSGSAAIEGDAGDAVFSFTVTLSAAAGIPVTVAYVTSNGTAQAGQDFLGATGSVLFLAGEVSASVDVPVHGDTLLESDETFSLRLFSAVNATIAVAAATSTILNDDAPPGLGIGNATVVEGSGVTNLLLIPVTLSTAVGVTVAVEFATVDETATAGLDFVTTNGVLSVLPGQTTGYVAVAVIGDGSYEGDESFRIDLQNAIQATITNASGTVTIQDDDGLPAISAGGVTASEGNAGETEFAFPVTLSAAAAVPVTVSFVTSNGTAAAGADFAGVTGQVTIAAGYAATSVIVRVTGDSLLEADETFTLHLYDPVNGSIAVAAVTGTILNDDAPPAIGVVDVAPAEGDMATNIVLVPVVLSSAAGVTVTVDFVTADVTATAGADYLATNGTLALPPGVVTGYVAVPIVGDVLEEGNETFTVSLSGAVNAFLDDGGAVVTIADDDAAVLSVAGVTQAEGGDGATVFSFALSLSASVGDSVFVSYETSNGTAVAGSDFVGATGTLVMAVGATTDVINVTVNGDTVFEGDEQFTLRITDVINASIGTGSAVGIIQNDDDPPHVAVSDLTHYEGSGGTSSVFLVAVGLSTSSPIPVSVDFDVQDGTALAGEDFVATNGTLVIAPGATNGFIAVDVLGDDVQEDDEAFTVHIANPTNAVIDGADGAVLVLNDDGLPVVAIAGVSATEGDAGTVDFVFPVTLSAVAAGPVTVNFATSNGSAQAGADYAGVAGTLTIAAGDVATSIVVSVSGDTLYEADETFTVHLLAPSNGLLGTASAVGTILEDDDPPAVAIGAFAQAEGTGVTNTFFIPVLLSAPVGVDVSVAFATSNGTAATGSDFVATNGTLVIAAGGTTGFVAVAVAGDTIYEGGETFFIDLDSAVHAVITNARATVTIGDDETPPVVSIAGVALDEGDAGTTDFTFPVTLSGAAAVTVTVHYAASNGSAQAGSDFLPAAGTIQFAPGLTSGSVNAVVSGDTALEGDEVFTMHLFNVQHAILGTATASGVIRDDEPQPSIRIGDLAQLEGSGGANIFLVPVVLSTAAPVNIAVDFATSNGTAQAGGDYAATNGTLVIPAGQTTGFVAVTVSGDLGLESDETFVIDLNNPVTAAIADGQGVVTIMNDDGDAALTVGNASVIEGDAASASLLFPVTLSATGVAGVSVGYVTSNGTATAGADFVGATGRLLIAAGTASTSIVISITGDTLFEGNEDFTLHLFSPSNAVIDVSSATGTILDDESGPSFSVGDLVQNEGSGGTNVLFLIPVTLAAPSPIAVSVSFETTAGSAVAGGDYLGTNGTLVIAAGAMTGFVSVVVMGESLHEADETFTVTLSTPSHGVLADASAQITIVNDDAPPGITVFDVVQNEGDAGTSAFVFNVMLAEAAGVTVRVDYATANVTALAGSDYEASAGTLEFPPGSTEIEVPVLVAGDTVYEGDETFSLNLANASNATLSVAGAFGIVQEDDPVPQLSVGDAAHVEGTGVTNLVLIPVVLSPAAGVDVSVDFATSNGTAVADADYIATNGTLVVPAGATSAVFAVAIAGDEDMESDETFFVTLVSAVHAAIADGTGLVTVLNDDGVALLSIGDATVAEGQAGTTSLSFPVSLSAPLGADVFVLFATSNGTATAGSDFAGATGLLVVAAGDVSTSIVVAVNSDTVFEGDETFTVNLFDTSNAVIAVATATGIIGDDDDKPALAIGDVSVVEGTGGATFVLVPVIVSTSAPVAITVDFATADGSALAGFDYVATNGTLIIPAGFTTGYVAVSVTGDASFEADEIFSLQLANPVNATNLDATGLVTIQNDDTPPSVSVGNASESEGDAGESAFVFGVVLSEPAGVPVTLAFATSNGTATAGTDYAATNGTLVINPGDAGTTIVVRIQGDAVVEGDETFTVHLSGASNATIAAGVGTGTILDDDAPPVLSIGGVALAEGDTGTTVFAFPVTLSGAADVAITVDFVTSNGTALAGTDYGAVTGVLVIAAGQTATSIVVQVGGDTSLEANENFSVLLANPSNATLGAAAAGGLIQNDDAPPALSVSGVSADEGNAGGSNFVFVVNVAVAAGLPIAVDFATSNGTAEAGSDYLAASGTLVLAPGATATSIAVVVTGDEILEGNETFALHLGNPSNTVLAVASATGVIVDDEARPVLEIGDVAAIEGSGEANVFLVTVSLSTSALTAVEVDFATADGTATGGTDFIPTNGTLVFAAGVTSASIAVEVVGDLLYEAEETFEVRLAAPQGLVTLVDTTAVLTIYNDDFPPGLAIGGVTNDEGQAGTTVFHVPVLLSEAAGIAVTVDYATADGSAVSGDDYVAATGTLSIPAGVTATSIAILVNGDTSREGDETLTVTLSNPSNGYLIASSTSVVIRDDEPKPVFAAADFSQFEGTGGTNVFIIPVTLSFSNDLAVSVAFATANGTGLAGTDYVATNGSLVFPAGSTNAQIPVTVLVDAGIEFNETFALVFSAPVNATLDTTQAVVTILNDDQPGVIVHGVTNVEGNGGVTSFVFPVTLNGAPGQTAFVSYETYDGSAVAGSDYQGVTGILTIPAGVTSTQIAIDVFGDTAAEGDETFHVSLFAPSNVVIAAGWAGAKILNDDGLPQLVVGNVSSNEGTGGTSIFQVPVSLATVAAVNVSVNFTTADGTAVAGSDFTSTNGTLVLAAGDTSAVLQVRVTADALFENDETFVVNFSGLVNATMAGTQSVVTIVDDDTAPTVVIDGDARNEGNSGLTAFIFPVSLAQPAGTTVTIDYGTADGTATAAGGDYVPAAGTLVIPAGVTSTSIAVLVQGDATFEGDETFSVALSNAVNAIVGSGPATGAILDDESGYEVYIQAVIDSGQRGYADDADGDGFPNLLEYVTGGSAEFVDTTALLRGTRSNGVLVLQFTRNTNAVDATLVVEGSHGVADGATWAGIAVNSNGAWSGSATVSEGAGNPAAVSVFDVDPAATNRHLRLRVTRP